MESHGEVGRIQLTQASHELLKDEFVCDPGGTNSIKGKGEMPTWYLLGRKGDWHPSGASLKLELHALGGFPPARRLAVSASSFGLEIDLPLVQAGGAMRANVGLSLDL